MMNKIDFKLFYDEFMRVLKELPEKDRSNRYLVAENARAKMDSWCRKQYGSKYDIINNYSLFKKDMSERFNQALDGYFKD